MATLTQRMEVVEERADSLESVLAASMARTDAAMTRTDKAIGRLERIIERREQEGARDREEAARERKEMNQRWGELANKMGTIVEDIVAPSIRRLARDVFDCGDLQFFATRTVRTLSDDPSREREFDALYVGTQAVLLNETKASARPEYARAFVDFLESGQFARYVPEYRELPIVPVFSSLSIPADVVTYLTRRGIYAVAMGDEAMQVLNLGEVRRRCAGAAPHADDHTHSHPLYMPQTVTGTPSTDGARRKIF